MIQLPDINTAKCRLSDKFPFGFTSTGVMRGKVMVVILHSFTLKQ